MRYCAFVLTLVVVSFLLVFGWRRNNGGTMTQPQQVVTVLRPVPSILNEDTLPSVDATETKITKTGVPFEFVHAQFVSENNGWVMSSHSLYRTTDGGKTWERLAQEPEKDARFVSFSFVDESHGWLAILKQDFADHYGVGNSSVIMVTDNGGGSWTLQASYPDEIEIRDIRFLNENEGFAVGAKGLENRADRCELFVIGTSNGGKEWNNISKEANGALKSQWGVPSECGDYIDWTSSSLLMLTEGGRVMVTMDKGKTWETVVRLKDERPSGFVSSTGFSKLALDPKNRIRVVGGASGDEGYWGDFVINEDGRWTSYEINLTPILDAVFLTDRDVIASGLNLRPSNDKPNRGLKNAGIILRSFDGGKSWQTIYRSKSFETFFYITKVKDNDFYAVSDTGTFLRFTLPQ